MKWLVCLISLFMLVPTTSQAQIAHTGVLCQTYQTLKKTHPSQRIFYEIKDKKRCYHVHAKNQTGTYANTSIGQWGVNFHPKNRNEEVLFYWSQPMMDSFYENATKGRNF